MSDLNDVFGEAKFGAAKTNWFRFPKEGGSLVLRILPPYGSLREAGRWSQFYAVHFGYRDTKGRLRPFQSSEVVNYRTKMVEVSDPAVERIKKIKSALEKAKVEGNQELSKKLSAQLQVFNVSKQHYMNVMDLNGKIGVISIPGRMKQALDEEIKRLQGKGVNPLSVSDGRFFVFTRTGTGPNTIHRVSVYQEEASMNGMTVQVEKKSALTAEVGSRIKLEGADLGKLYPKISSEDIGLIVAGDGKVLEDVLAKYRPKRDDSSGSGGGGSQEPLGLDEEMLSMEEEIVAAPAAAPAQVAAPVQAAQAPVVASNNLESLSDDEFLKSMGL